MLPLVSRCPCPQWIAWMMRRATMMMEMIRKQWRWMMRQEEDCVNWFYSGSIETGLYLQIGALKATRNKGIPDPKHCEEENMWNNHPHTEEQMEMELQQIKEEKSGRTKHYKSKQWNKSNTITCNWAENEVELIDAEMENAVGNNRHNSNRWTWIVGLWGVTWQGPETSMWAWQKAVVRSESESKVGNSGKRQWKEWWGRWGRLEVSIKWTIDGNGAGKWEREANVQEGETARSESHGTRRLEVKGQLEMFVRCIECISDKIWIACS